MAQACTTGHVALVVSPGIGHIVPAAEVARRLLHHGITCTLIVPTVTSSPSSHLLSVLHSLPSEIRHVLLPSPAFEDISSDDVAGAKVLLAVQRSLPSIRQIVTSLRSSERLLALVVDLFSTDAFGLVEGLHIPRYLLFPSSATCLSITLHVPTFDEAFRCDARDLPEPVRLPGCLPIDGRDLMTPLQDRGNKVYSWFVHHAKQLSLADGILLNSYAALEPDVLHELGKENTGNPPIYPVGPIVSACERREGEGNGWLKWLDDQPRRSVLFVCLGSGGTLSSLQQWEMALGLEISQQRFLWVVRPPNDESPSGAYHDTDANDDLDGFLPEGFAERVEGRGLLVPNWASQTDILSHGSIGGFLTHCGWNSSLEAAANGLPMIAWPMYSEQRANAALLVDGLMVALRPENVGEVGSVGREEIARVIEELMVGDGGKNVRRRAAELGKAAVKALAHDGSASRSLAEVARKWMDGWTQSNLGNVAVPTFSKKDDVQ